MFTCARHRRKKEKKKEQANQAIDQLAMSRPERFKEAD